MNKKDSQQHTETTSHEDASGDAVSDQNEDQEVKFTSGKSNRVERSIHLMRQEAEGLNRSDGRGREYSKNTRGATNHVWEGRGYRQGESPTANDSYVHGTARILGADSVNAAYAAETGDLLDIVRRQWPLMLALILGITISGYVLLSQLTPLYTAKAELIIEAQRPSLPTLEAVLPGIGTDRQSILTEIAVLRSRVLLGSVAERLDLANDPEFNTSLSSSGIGARLKQALGTTAESTAHDPREEVIVNSLFDRLDVTEVRDSRVISVGVTSESPEKAAQIANALVDEYIESRRAGKLAATSDASSWLDQRIAELQAKLLESEQRVEEFRSSAELLEAGGTTLISQQLADLNGQIIVARTGTGAARAELTQVADLVEGGNNGIYASDGVLRSPLMQELRRQQVVLEREIAESSTEIGPAHPRMIQLKADAADLENQISIEIRKIEEGLRNAVKVAEAREAGLERQAAELKARLSQTNEDEIELRALVRESDANRQLLETLLARQKELGSPDQVQTGQPDARIISYAAVPLNQSFPQIGVSMAGIFFVSIILALTLVFIREIRRSGFVTLEQLESVNQLTALGFVPFLSSRRHQSEMLDSVVKNPASPFAQAVRTLSWQLNEAIPKDAKVVLITSALPGEGKTTIAIGLARARALKGEKTLLIDADLRSPSIHKKLELSESKGLRGVLNGEIDLADAILTDRISDLDVLISGETSAEALDAIESPRMQSSFAELAANYDVIIVDSPPISVAPDACVLSQLADTTVLAVKWMESPVASVKYALRMLDRNGGHVTGTTLTMVGKSGPSYQHYGYVGQYGDKEKPKPA